MRPDGRCVGGVDLSADGFCGVVLGRIVNRWTRGLSGADGAEGLAGAEDRTWESDLPAAGESAGRRAVN